MTKKKEKEVLKEIKSISISIADLQEIQNKIEDYLNGCDDVLLEHDSLVTIYENGNVKVNFEFNSYGWLDFKI